MAAGNKGPNKGWSNLKPAKPGEVRNPAGRPKSDVNVVELARACTEKAIRTLEECLDSDKDSVRVASAIALLDRGHGKPHQVLTGVDGGPVKVDVGMAEMLRKLVAE